MWMCIINAWRFLIQCILCICGQYLLLSVCRSGLWDLEAYSLLGSGVPVPEHRLSRSLDSVPTFRLPCFSSVMFLVPPFPPPPRCTRVPCPPGHFARLLSPFFLLPLLCPFLCGRPSTSSSGWASVVRLSEDSFTTLRLAADKNALLLVSCPAALRGFATPLPPDLCGWWYLAWVWVEGRRRRRPPQWYGFPWRVGRCRPG